MHKVVTVVIARQMMTGLCTEAFGIQLSWICCGGMDDGDGDADGDYDAVGNAHD